jgi:hypothetical protein
LQKLVTPDRFLGRAKVNILLNKQGGVEIFLGYCLKIIGLIFREIAKFTNPRSFDPKVKRFIAFESFLAFFFPSFFAKNQAYKFP